MPANELIILICVFFQFTGVNTSISDKQQLQDIRQDKPNHKLEFVEVSIKCL